MNKLLTKSRYLYGLQCSTLLWLSVHAPEKIPKAEIADLHRIEQGREVGDFAKKLFPEGVSISYADFDQNLLNTKKLISQRKVFFEGGILEGSLYSRADILVPSGNQEWDILEVKSSTSAKEEHIHDVSYQRFVYEKSGLKIRKCFVVHVNRDFVKNGDIDPQLFFLKQDITSEVNEVSKGIEKRISFMLDILNSQSKPISRFPCESPKNCPVCDECWEVLPKENVFSLYRGGKKCSELYSKGIKLLKEIPAGEKLSEPQKIQVLCSKSGMPNIKKEGISAFLQLLKEPSHFLDFETYSLAIPRYDGMKPYQQIPFQFSLHTTKDGSVNHQSYLADSSIDPRKEFIERLNAALGKEGSVVVYNQSFEQTRLKELSRFFPEFEAEIKSILPRFVDLLKPFRNFDYYNPSQEGSASIKKVLPALTGKSYGELEVANGASASTLFYNTTLGKLSKEETNKIREDLVKYCTLDTEGMIWILDELRKLSGGSKQETF